MAMKQLTQFRITKRAIVLLAIGIILLSASILIAQAIHVNTTASRMAALELQKATAAARIVAYDKSRCENNASIMEANTLTKYSIESGGYTRSYNVHTPAAYDPARRYPVVISFDGIEGSGLRMEGYSGLDTLPAIVVYPDALAGKQGFTAWQGAPYSVDGERDVQFVKDLVTKVTTDYCVDTDRTFAVGMSNGGSFAAIVGCEMGDRIRAIASVSGAYYTTCQQEQKSPSLLVLHSTGDQQVPFAGVPARNLPQIPEWVTRQAMERQCMVTEPATTDGAASYFNWRDCKEGAIVRFAEVQGQPHGWLRMPSQINAPHSTADYIWKFFEDAVPNSE